MSEQTRYVVVKGSQSGHCCFDWTVVDTERPYQFGGVSRYEPVCETMERDEADRIAAALNAFVENRIRLPGAC